MGVPISFHLRNFSPRSSARFVVVVGNCDVPTLQLSQVAVTLHLAELDPALRDIKLNLHFQAPCLLHFDIGQRLLATAKLQRSTNSKLASDTQYLQLWPFTVEGSVKQGKGVTFWGRRESSE